MIYAIFAYKTFCRHFKLGLSRPTYSEIIFAAYKTKKTLYCGGAKSKPLKKCLQNYCLQNNSGVVNVS